MLPAQHPDLNGVSVLRQYVAEERLGTPVFVGRVGSRHAVFTQGNLGQQHPGEAIIVNNLVHWNLDFEVWAAWCQSCPWASTNQLDRQKEAEMEIRPVGGILNPVFLPRIYTSAITLCPTTEAVNPVFVGDHSYIIHTSPHNNKIRPLERFVSCLPVDVVL